MALLPVADALAQVLDGVEPLSTERVALAEAEGRVLAEDLKSAVDLPRSIWERVTKPCQFSARRQ